MLLDIGCENLKGLGELIRTLNALYINAYIARRWGSMKVLGSGFLGFVTSGLLNL